MKKLRLFLKIGTLAAVCCAAFALFTGCGGEELSKPSGVYVDDISQYLTLNWNAVKNASKYTVEMNGETQEVRRNTFTIDDIAPGR